jgi:ferredoxin
MIVWIVAGESVFALLILFFVWFFCVSLAEKEKKAAIRSGIFCVFLMVMNFLLFLSPPPTRVYLFAGVVVISISFIFLFLLTLRANTEIEIVGDQKRIDERDVIFARFDLQEGNQTFNDYYERHPEFFSKDNPIRRSPDLFDPIHNKKDPMLFSLASAEFGFLEHQLSQVDGSPESQTVSLSEDENSRFIKQVIKYLGSDLCGIAALDQSYVYSHTGRGPDVYGEKIVLDHKYAIVFAVEMELSMVAAAPRAPVVVETGKQYVEAAKISIITADLIRRMGFSARAHIAGSNYQAVLPPLGWKAGLGELGRMGTLITDKYGPRSRLGLVTTSFPLKTDKPIKFGVQDFCGKCRKCAVNCPSQAIPHGEKKEDNGVLKWVLDREDCYRYWRSAGTDCAVCMYVCPYSKPVNAFHNVIRNFAAMSSFARSLSVWGDDFFYGKKPRRKKAPF